MEIIQQLGGYSYLGVFVVGLLANLIIPVPEEVSLLTIGYLSGTGVFSVFIVIPILITGLLINDVFLYFLSKKGSRFTTQFYKKFFESRFDFLKEIDNNRVEKIILFSRFFAFFRFLAPFLAGIHNIGFKRFVYLEICSITLYTSIYVFLGYYLRNQIEKIISGVNMVGHIISGIIILVLFSILFNYLKKYLIQHVGFFRENQK
jgi:membrane protein DedA with SNARE-associated domain